MVREVRESDSDGDVYSGVYAGVDFISSISLALFLFRVSRERLKQNRYQKKRRKTSERSNQSRAR